MITEKEKKKKYKNIKELRKAENGRLKERKKEGKKRRKRKNKRANRTLR